MEIYTKSRQLTIISNTKCVYLVLLIIVLLSCKEKVDLPTGKEIDSDLYKTKIDSLKEDSSCYGDRDLKLIAINNPESILDNSFMVVYFNECIAYSGSYKKEVLLSIPNMQQNEITHLKIELLKNKKLYILENKSVFNWIDDYKFIYFGVFFENSSSDQIQFFPQQLRVIQ